jgi:hypothetical protein
MTRRWLILVLAGVLFVGAGSTLHHASYHTASGSTLVQPATGMPWES